MNRRLIEACLANVAVVVGVANYDQARFALDQGVGGLIIPSWADPALLTEDGRNINALREQYDRPFSVAVDFEGGRVQRHTQVLGEFMPPRALAGQPPEVIRGTGYDIGRSLRERGLKVATDADPLGVTLVTSDAHAGLKAAVKAILPGAGWQRSLVKMGGGGIVPLVHPHRRERTLAA